jgi:Ca2+-binding EF-hand superfamily protein
MKNLTLALLLVTAIAAPSFAKKAESTENTVQLSPEESAEKLLKANDSNKDGKLAKNEVNLTFRVKRFTAVDKNKDGFLDKEELVQSFEKTATLNKQAQ